MADFTYETTDKREIYETYEWDNVWIDHTNDTDAKRVLYIGDSISCGTRKVATEHTGGNIFFDGFGTSKGIDNPFFKDALSIFAKQQPRRDIVIFNNGLHGWHLDDEKEYASHYEDMIKFLLSEFKGTPVAVLLTTHVADGERDARVKVRNEIAKTVAEKYDLPVIDFYSVSVQNAHLLTGDGVHFQSEGYKKLAETVVNSIIQIVPEMRY